MRRHQVRHLGQALDAVDSALVDGHDDPAILTELHQAKLHVSRAYHRGVELRAAEVKAEQRLANLLSDQEARDAVQAARDWVGGDS